MSESPEIKKESIWIRIWNRDISTLPTAQRVYFKSLRILHLVCKGFVRNEMPMHSSALTFSTLMAIVPILALSLALARGFGDIDNAKARIKQTVSRITERIRDNSELIQGQKTVKTPKQKKDQEGDEYNASRLASEIDGMVDTAFEKVEKISFAAIGGIGLLLLLWSVIDVLSQVELSFNKIWGVPRQRTLWRKCVDYLGVAIILPFLLLLASSIPILNLITSVMNKATASWFMALIHSPLLKNMTIVIMMSVAFAFLIMFMPNKKVKMSSGVVGGITAGILFVIWLMLCSALQIGLARFGKIYGSFAFVPIILLWVFISWQIVLIGAQTAYAYQYCSILRLDLETQRTSVLTRLTVALSVLIETAKSQAKGKMFEKNIYADKHHVPLILLDGLLEQMEKNGFMVRVADKEDAYVMVRQPSDVFVYDVGDMIIKSGVGPEKLGMIEAEFSMSKIIDTASACFDRTLGKRSIGDMISG